MLLVILLWFLTISVVSYSSGWYIKVYGRSDLAVVFYIIYLALAQILATKISTFNFGIFSISAPAAVLIFPFTFQIIDIVNEAFGKSAVRRMILLAFLSQVFMNLFLIMGLNLPPAPFWSGNETWQKIFALIPRITIASWIAFLLSQNFDAFLYDFLRRLTKEKMLWLRNVVSDVLSLTLDSFLFITLAFYGRQPVIPLIFGQIIIKGIIGGLDFPFLYLSRWAMGKKFKGFFPKEGTT
ncbi:MAG: queuosine precursor transporter [candidate division WOR-3 bacterium]